DAGAYEVEAVIAPKANAGAVGEAVALCTHRRGHRAESLQLHDVQRVVLLGARKVTVQGVDREALECINFARPHSKSVDPGIDHHVTWTIGSDLFPASNLIEAVETRACMQPQGRFRIVPPDAVQHDQAHLGG